MVPYIVTDNNIHINNSCSYSKKQFGTVYNVLRGLYPDNAVLNNRSNYSLSCEWATHNLLYDLHIFRSRTADVDLNYPQKWYEKIGYFLVGSVALLLIK